MTITKDDIELVSSLETYTYVQSMEGVVSESEQENFRIVKKRLKRLSDNYKIKYDNQLGALKSESASGNPISYHGILRRVWSEIYKGTGNKQYSAQISFVINTKDKGLDVGFYFGRASAIKLSKVKRLSLEEELKKLGKILYNEIENNSDLKASFSMLFDYGFKAEIHGKRVTSDEWLKNVAVNPAHSSVTYTILPNAQNIIDPSFIDLYVSMVVPLIAVLPDDVNNVISQPRKFQSLTPEQRAKQAEKRTLIGLYGEKYILNIERQRFLSEGIEIEKLMHISLTSDREGYDIQSYDKELDHPIYIEVKTTTLLKTESWANIFYITAKEYNVFMQNMSTYRLYRVYDIYGDPCFEIIDLSQMNPEPATYLMKVER